MRAVKFSRITGARTSQQRLQPLLKRLLYVVHPQIRHYLTVLAGQEDVRVQTARQKCIDVFLEVSSNRRTNMTLTEKEKMLAGELYRSTDLELQAGLAQAQQHLRRLNAIPNEEVAQRFGVLQVLLGQIGSCTQIKSPFCCDYGLHIRLGRNGFVNYGCVFLDCNLIIVGDDAQIGPGVHIYTAYHPVDAETRRSGLEAAKPVSIGHNVWLGGHCIICPGVTIGDNSVIGAGSVVVGDIPSNRVAVGNPCRIIKQVGE